MLQKMRICLLIALFSLLCGQEVFGDDENNVKKGTFPYMAFVYYPDETVTDSGVRFLRHAILIRQQWLISSLIEVNNGAFTFPQKTLIARAGSVIIDPKMTLNEDDYEQEQEVIQIIRPYNVTSEWWYNDISLLKTLLPFNNSDSVAPMALPSNQEYPHKSCFILVYVRKNEKPSDDRILIKLGIEHLSTSEETCGGNFRKNSMICASNPGDNKNPIFETNFCEGNNGGPLICGGQVIGTQTYINDCKEPLLYQLLSAWKEFIHCGSNDKCHKEDCKNMCSVVDKDPHQLTSQKEPSTPITIIVSTDNIQAEVEVSLTPITGEELKYIINAENEPTTENKDTNNDGRIQNSQDNTSVLQNEVTTIVPLATDSIDEKKGKKKGEERTRKTNIEAKKLGRTNSSEPYNILSLYCLLAIFLNLVYFA